MLCMFGGGRGVDGGIFLLLQVCALLRVCSLSLLCVGLFQAHLLIWKTGGLGGNEGPLIFSPGFPFPGYRLPVGCVLSC